MKSVRAGKLV